MENADDESELLDLGEYWDLEDDGSIQTQVETLLPHGASILTDSQEVAPAVSEQILTPALGLPRDQDRHEHHNIKVAPASSILQPLQRSIKRRREKKRRDDMNLAMRELLQSLTKVDFSNSPSDNTSVHVDDNSSTIHDGQTKHIAKPRIASPAVSSSYGQRELITKTVEILRQLHAENVKHKFEVNLLSSLLSEMRRNTHPTSSFSSQDSNYVMNNHSQSESASFANHMQSRQPSRDGNETTLSTTPVSSHSHGFYFYPFGSFVLVYNNDLALLQQYTQMLQRQGFILMNPTLSQPPENAFHRMQESDTGEVATGGNKNDIDRHTVD